MKEILTKSFWQGVKKTFHEALEDSPPSTGKALETPAQDAPIASSTSDTSSSSATHSPPPVP